MFCNRTFIPMSSSKTIEAEALLLRQKQNNLMVMKEGLEKATNEYMQMGVKKNTKAYEEEMARQEEQQAEFLAMDQKVNKAHAPICDSSGGPSMLSRLLASRANTSVDASPPPPPPAARKVNSDGPAPPSATSIWSDSSLCHRCVSHHH